MIEEFYVNIPKPPKYDAELGEITNENKYDSEAALEYFTKYIYPQYAMYDFYKDQAPEYNLMYSSFLIEYYGMSKKEKSGAKNAGILYGLSTSGLKQIYDIIQLIKSLKHIKPEHIKTVVTYIYTTLRESNIIELWDLIEQTVKDAYKDYQGKDDFDKGIMIGHTVGEIFVDIVFGIAKGGEKAGEKITKELIEDQLKDKTLEIMKKIAIQNIIDSKKGDELLEYLLKAFKNDEVIKLATETGDVVEAVLEDFPEDIIRKVTKLKIQREEVLKVITDLSPTELKSYYRSMEVIDDKVKIVTKTGETIEVPNGEFREELFRKVVEGTGKAVDEVPSGSFGKNTVGAAEKYVPNNIKMAKNNYLKKKGIDAHALKTEIIGNKNISHYDLYVDKDSGMLWLYRKGGIGEPIPTYEFIK